MKFILGEKIAMSQRFKANGEVVPVTLVKAGPCQVTQVKSKDKEGYNSIQIGFGLKKVINKPLLGHLKDLENFRYLKEFVVEDIKDFSRGQKLDVSIFQPGDIIEVAGTSKGKGFQGVVKRHHFHGHPASRGHKDQLRMPGSIGSRRQGPPAKGKRMGGRMGGERVTVKNLEIVEVDPQNNLLAIKGAIPGVRHSLVLIAGAGEMKLNV